MWPADSGTVPDDWAGYLEQSPEYLRRVCCQLTVIVPSILQPNFSDPQSVVVGTQEIQQISLKKTFLAHVYAVRSYDYDIRIYDFLKIPCTVVLLDFSGLMVFQTSFKNSRNIRRNLYLSLRC